MAYPPFQTPPGYYQFTVQMFSQRNRIESGKLGELERTKYPVKQYIDEYGLDTVKEWAAVYCEVGSKHEETEMYQEIIASIQVIEHAYHHAARSEEERMESVNYLTQT